MNTLWQDLRYGARTIAGRSVSINGNPSTVIGVMPEGFRYGDEQLDLFVPMHNITIDGVGLSVGFKSAKSFRRAFERRFGVTPGGYRSRIASGKELYSRP